jgi:iron complex transport system substrate-binding protein
MMLSRRELVASSGLLVAGLGVATLTGCAGDPTPTADTSAGAQPLTAEEGALPVTIEHRYGSTTIDTAPTRVVCVGMKEQDDLLALGITPVGATEWLAFDESQGNGLVGEWAVDLVGDREITKLNMDDGIEYEKIAGLQPDLIFALYSGITAEEYEKLTALAPVVASPDGLADYGIDWEQQALIVGKAVGQPQKMQQLVDEAKAKITKVGEGHPEFAEQTGLVATLYEGIYHYGPQDPRSRLIAQLGFELPDDLADLTGTETFGASISPEKVEIVDTDLLIWLTSPSTEDFKNLESNKLYSNLRVAKEGRAMTIATGTELDNAFNFVSVLSIPFLLEELVPQLELVTDGDPETNPSV